MCKQVFIKISYKRARNAVYSDANLFAV